ncbi:MAG: hypothetical protein E6I32_05565 [Chloroflexi bacterium]|nr:MAG: hypothetical protein E6I32_05565 [Chloroflexota bacterium]
MEPDKPSRYNLQQEQLILPERVTVRDPRGGQYVIVSVLGKGEFGAVYLVRERQSKHDLFALKEIINPNKDEREHFTFEAEVLKRLNHVALPRVHRVFENDRLKRVYLLMDYISGRNLEALRQEQPAKCFSLPLALALLAPIADALSYLHANPPISLCQKQEARPCWSILARPKNICPVQSQMSCPAVHLATPLLNYTGREPIPELISTAWERPSMCC